MSDAKSPPDLAFQEIVEKIREMLAEDERSSTAATSMGTASSTRSGAGAPSGASEEAAKIGVRPSAGAASDVLELTEALNADGSVRHLAPIGSSSHATDRLPEPAVAAVAVEAEAELKSEPELRPESPRYFQAREERSAANDEQLVSEVTSLAAAAAFARLAGAPRTRREPPLLGDRPLDDVVQDLLRPLLQTWLDENLPAIVERLVKAEIARVTSRSELG